jgi:hypothetical protein
MKLAIILIATGGEQYMKFVTPLIDSLKEFFPPHDVILFTDSKSEFSAIKISQENLGWPKVTLMRYHAMIKQAELLLTYDQVFYMDIDMLVVSPVTENDIFSKGITAVIHPGYPTSFERNSTSTAYIQGNPPYYQGCLVGGDAGTFLAMCETIAANVDIDTSRGITAVWHDESHLNKYLYDHPPARVLSPSYCFPENYRTSTKFESVPNDIKIWHLEKGNANRPGE